jgi:short-subunit dehydrogenase
MSLALITGASKGIGKAITEELAKEKVNVLLVARSESLLQQQVTYLSSTYQIQADYLAIDLATEGASQKIVDWCLDKKYSINILVNNAGYGLSGAFEKYSLQEYKDMMQVNMNVPVELCNLLIPYLSQQPKGYILNIASSAAYQAVPGLSIYAATKSFLLSFSRGLRFELRNSAISVTTVCPGATDTNFPDRAKVGEKARKAAAKVNMTPAEVAKIAVKALFDKKTEVITGAVNKAGAFMAWLLPKRLVEKIAGGIYE